ncbi:unnamed protein product [Arabidopsis lyrata]|uniref:uncharacterized protein LOC9308060 n=1 Tax=Arabidopsis lyrata subsp. lyrata TaxID=81972 RepID=UPI000A29BB6B|nr:uncharacterized protein LOC9308060 [Arabidopsis lyrata subsp. lyrata]CAH8271840.1 unnamed protein product [Arabidopsis lyrata]|eukprot:XP_020879423.1 uncharacterized protein LOC9308060 [Arabidopsis lyrata subsp. lyrata]
MANRQMEIETGFPTPPSSATDPPPPSRWWTQLHSLFLRRNELTKEEKSAIFLKPYLCGGLTILAFLNILLHIDKLFCHVSFSVESISVSPSSSATWHVDFLVNPSSWCPIDYNGDDVYAKLGSLNAAVLKTSRKRGSRGGHTSFSVDLAKEGNQRVFELDMKLSAKKKSPAYGYEYGHLDIRCQNLTIGYQKTKCHSSFKALENTIPKLLD